MRTLILGGARSGKSRFAEELLASAAEPVIYVATGQAGDQEMTERIAHHRARRPDHWTTLDVPLDLAATLADHRDGDRLILVDCLTLWLSNITFGERDVDREGRALAAELETFTGDIVLVSNEVGMGLVPESPLGRSFRDAQGRLNQLVATVCDRVIFVAAGLPIYLKGSNPDD